MNKPKLSNTSNDDLNLKKSLLPDELMFKIENITGTIEEFPILKAHLSQTETLPLSTTEQTSLHTELSRMKIELLCKQKIYQEQFEKLQNWMKESFEVESPQILLDHQAKIKETEIAEEEAANQGNSKQHQRIKALSLNLAEIQKSSKQEQEIELLTTNTNTATHTYNNININSHATSQESLSESNSNSVRASKNMSRMNQINTQMLSTTSGHGQKDFLAVKSKIPNQIPINVFWNYIEPFFKPIDEDDLKYLDDPSSIMDVAPFVIPPLGLHYEKIWYEQYGYVVPGGENKKRSDRVLSDQNGRHPVQLLDRLMSALVDKEAIIPNEFEEEFQDEESNFEVAGTIESHPIAVPLDDRIRSSLIELGFTDLVNSRDYQENDEICVEMRSIQRQLREQIVLNQYRKKRLAEFIRTKLASQEFYSLIGDLDKQIDGIFQKRVKNVKKKKGKTTTGVSDPTSSVVSTNEIPSEALQNLENRRKLLETFSQIVSSRIESLCPFDLIDFDVKVEEDIILTAKKSSKWMPLPDICLKQPLTSSQPAFPNSR